jgi:hypothetical protein
VIVLPGADRKHWKRLNKLIADWLHIDLDTFQDDMDELLHARFPEIVVLQHRDKCERTLRELLLFAEDGYEHELDALHSYALLRALESAHVQEGDMAKDSTDDPAKQREHEQRTEKLDRLCEDAFVDHDFEDVETIAQDVLNGGPMRAHLKIDARDFLDLWPDDIAKAVLEHLKAAEERRPASSPSPPDTPPP